MRKFHFASTHDNKVLIKPKGAEQSLKAHGRFIIDKSNSLIYLLNKSTKWRRDHELPKKLRFKGKWNLSHNHNLELILDKTRQQFKDDYLRLYGKILCIEENSLVFQIKSLDKRGVNRFRLLRLSGIWQADKYNRIIFQVRKRKKPDTLIFKQAWQVNDNQQIIYEYERTELQIKRKIKNSLTFTGFWQILSANRLRYILSHSNKSGFDFRVQLETPNVYPKKGAIKYRLGIGTRDDLGFTKHRIITLFGTWKFSRRIGVYFEMDYGAGNIRKLIFDTEINLNKKDKVIFKLLNQHGKRLGISVVFQHRLFSQRDAEWFLRLRKDNLNKSMDTGVRLAF